MDITPTIRVEVTNQFNQRDFACISAAKEDDMPHNWKCNWINLYQSLEREYLEDLVKIEHQGVLVGLMKFALYPDPPNQIEVIELLNIEASPKDRRLVNPVGKWLVWYACRLALKYCPQEPSAQIFFLTALAEAFDFYRTKVNMEYIGVVTITSGEEGYAFRFNRESAVRFCNSMEKTYGSPAATQQ